MDFIDNVNTNTVTLVIIAAAFLVGLSPVIADEVLLSSQTSSFNTSVTVIQTDPAVDNLTVGVDLAKDMKFGELPWNVTADRSFNMSTSNTALVTIGAEGNISEYLNYTSPIYINKGRKQVEVTMVPSKPGYYEGKVIVKTQVAKNDLGRQWLNLKRQLPSF